MVVTAGQMKYMTYVYGIFAVSVGFKLESIFSNITAGILKSS